jgi:hypothetical protein
MAEQTGDYKYLASFDVEFEEPTPSGLKEIGPYKDYVSLLKKVKIKR